MFLWLKTEPQVLFAADLVISGMDSVEISHLLLCIFLLTSLKLFSFTELGMFGTKDCGSVLKDTATFLVVHIAFDWFCTNLGSQHFLDEFGPIFLYLCIISGVFRAGHSCFCCM